VESCKDKKYQADLVSRGVTPKELRESQLCWSGSAWLKNSISIKHQWLLEELKETSLDDSIQKIVMLTTAEQSNNSLINRFSTFRRLIRVTATCLRFANLCRKKEVDPSSPLIVEELEYAKRCLIKMEQLSAFGSEIESLRKNNAIAKSSKLKHLNPFRDQNGLLRVGDRLRYADLQCDTRHPLLLPPIVVLSSPS